MRVLAVFLSLGLMMCWATIGLPAQAPPPPSPTPPPSSPASAEAVDIEGWLRENLDDDVFTMLLGEVDFQQVQAVFGDLLRKLEGSDAYDLATMRAAAIRVLPLLKQFEETQPYADWLETQLDYIEVADQLQRVVKPVPPKPGAPAVRPAPRPEVQKPIWEKRLVKRPWPPAAQSLIPRLKRIFRSVGVPAEMVWLAEVESSFNSKARSPKGAAGLFQLMPATARSLGLSTGWFFDDRFDVEESSRAAARYLKALYQRFGDWRLVLAAYNSGEGRVGQLLAGAKEKSFAAIAPRLPAETQLYVPRFEATLQKREGVPLNRIGPAR